MSRTSVVIGSLLTAVVLAACTDATAPLPATEVPALATLPAACANITMPVTSIIVVNRIMPAMRYTVANCGSRKVTVVVTPYEVFGQMSEVCPAPVPAPVRITINPGRSTKSSFATLRGPCGFVSPLQQTLVQGTASWQAHRLMISVRNATRKRAPQHHRQPAQLAGRCAVT